MKTKVLDFIRRYLDWINLWYELSENEKQIVSEEYKKDQIRKNKIYKEIISQMN